jgi:hypothetical protein
MSWPVVIVASGGLPVTLATNGLGLPYEEATNGFGVAVTFVASGGLPVVLAPTSDPDNAIVSNTFPIVSDGYFIVSGE